MKKSILTLISFAVVMISIASNSVSSAQIIEIDQVDWHYSVEQDGEDVTVVVVITIMDGWQITVANPPLETFFFPLSLEFKSSPNYTVFGKVKQPRFWVEYEEDLDEYLQYFTGKIEIRRSIKVKSTADFKIHGEFEFQAYSDTSALVPIMEEFELDIEGVTIINTTIEE